MNAWLNRIRMALLLVALCPACGSSPTPADEGDAGGADAAVGDSGPGDSGPGDSGPGDSGPGDSGPGDAGPGDAGVDSVTILTINFWNRVLNGNWDERRAMIVGGITSWQPDVVCVQESTSTAGGEFDAEVVARESGYGIEHITTASIPFSYDEGIAALSRWPIRASDNEQLPITDLGFADRYIMSVDVERPDGVLRVFCSHLSISSDESAKAGEAAQAWQFMDARRATTSGFFAGDLNARPDTLAMRLLRGDASHGGVTGDLIDAWTSAHPGDPGLTHPSDAPEKRIDYVYVVPPTAGPAAMVVDCERVFTEPVGGVYASDHIGLLCTFSR